MARYADIIIDISSDRLDQAFTYRVPEALEGKLEPGSVVEAPFGRGDRLQRGYVLRLSDHTSCPPERLKDLASLVTDLSGGETTLISLALWMRDYYGSTTVQALRTVLPFRQKAPAKKKKQLVLAVPPEEAEPLLEEYRKKHRTARARLLEALLENPVLPMEIVTASLKVTSQVWRPMEEQGILRVESERVYRTPALLESLREEGAAREASPGRSGEQPEASLSLTTEQRLAVERICSEWEKAPAGRYLIHGVTGSGKTEVYMELIAYALSRGEQAILLIPEISLTYQNVIRFYRRFGDRISVLHSRLSKAERYDQFERAREGEIDVMIGPRSALFTPFPRLGLILIDEEHEASYRSEAVPRYHARETAAKRASLEGARLVLGSATPSMEAYYGAQQGEYRLITLKNRPAGGALPQVYTVDLRQELQEGNRSMFSRLLFRKLEDCLGRGEQAMLFLNRRGYSGFVSCRSCGHVMKCPHCDVSLSLHKGGRLVCHYCGYEERAVKKCPRCGSPFIGGFKAGTQQIEEAVQSSFPQARILRMDADTTRGKDGHAEILRAFGNREADILIGTQMIVKGHDFPAVTLVGILAADLSLNVEDYRAAERTFQLLTQAAGRAGRGKTPGEVVVQTYSPEHYAITCAARQAYEPFYEKEIQYRQLAGYPPVGGMLALHISGPDPEKLAVAANYLARFVSQAAGKYGALAIGPSEEAVAKINDVYRQAIYVKHWDTETLIAVKNLAEQYIEINDGFRGIQVQMEMN